MNGKAKPAAEKAQFLYYCFYKPFGVLSQFSDEGGNPGLKSIIELQEDVYPVGRLDVDSEGLLLLTNDTQLNHKLLDPMWGHWRTYWVQVEGEVTKEALKKLQAGVEIRIQKKDYTTLPARAHTLAEPVTVPERNPPIRFRKSIPTSWISLSLQEGKNRQVRRMTAAVGFPTLRLIRVSMEGLSLDQMEPGDLRELPQQEVFSRLKIDPQDINRNIMPRRERPSRPSGKRF